MHVRCPHCHSPIELLDDAPLKEIECRSCGSSFSLIGGESTASYHEAEQRILGHFKLVEHLGAGRFGNVWKAKDTELDRTVAIKIPRSDQLDADETETFFREARAAAQLKHPSIVSVHELGREDDTVYIVSDYVEGANLRQWLSGRRLSVREAADLCAKLAAALHHAHEHGVVHRDLKPSNIMLDLLGQPHVMDFGLAKRDAGEITMTVDGQILGTPAYMPPEQARGEGHKVDRRADIYSLGVILFELLTGELPFRGDKRMLIVQILKDDPPSPRKLNQNVPRDLETICLKCLQKDPALRYATAQSIADDLSRWLHNEPIVARPVTRIERGWRWCRRNPAVAGLIAGFLFVVCLALLALSETRRRMAVEALVDRLATSAIDEAPSIIDEIRSNWSNAQPLLRAMLRDAQEQDDAKAELHASLALIHVDPSLADDLVDRLLRADVKEVAIIARYIPLDAPNAAERLWHAAENGSHGEKLRAGAALAALDEDNGRWHGVSDDVVAAWLTSPPFESRRWIELLRPAGGALVRPLERLFRDTGSKRSDERPWIATALADYLADDARTLCELILLADDEREFEPLIEALHRHRSTATEELQPLLGESLPNNTADWESFVIRQSNAAVSLVALGEWAAVSEVLGDRRRSLLRNRFIERYPRLGADPQRLAALLSQVDEGISRYGLILALGDADPAKLSRKQRRSVVERLIHVYLHDPSPSVHGAASWTLHQWEVPVPNLPPGLPNLNDEQQRQLAKLVPAVKSLRQELADHELRIPALQTAWEDGLRDQPLNSSDSLDEGLFAHFTFDETEGVSTANRVDPEASGVYEGSDDLLWEPGVDGQAIRLSGSGDVVVGRPLPFDSQHAFSFGCWFTADELDGTILISNEDPQNGHRGVDLAIYKGRFEVMLSSGASKSTYFHFNRIKVTAAPPAGFPQDYWQHLFATYDGGGKAQGVAIYLNGERLPVHVSNDALDGSIATDVLLRIGGRPPGTFRYSGRIDDVRIYDRQLEPDEVRQLFQAGLRAVAGAAPGERTSQQQGLLDVTYPRRDERLQDLRRRLAEQVAEMHGTVLRGPRRWFVNSQGQCFAIVRAPSDSHLFALATHEVTVADFQKFQPQLSYHPNYAPETSCPAHNVSWFEAAAYCNWLNEQEGIPRDEWCYLPDDGRYDAGMTIPRDFHARTGYRLPTYAEWNSVCRAGNNSRYSFGTQFELLDRYAWTMANSGKRSHPAGTLRPTLFGMLDMHGNVREWCHDVFDESRRNNNLTATESFRKTSGIEFDVLPRENFAGDAFGERPDRHYYYIGFRLARTLPPTEFAAQLE